MKNLFKPWLTQGLAAALVMFSVHTVNATPDVSVSSISVSICNQVDQGIADVDGKLMSGVAVNTADLEITCVTDECISVASQETDGDGWTLSINCGGTTHKYSGGGIWGGTLCGWGFEAVE